MIYCDCITIFRVHLLNKPNHFENFKLTNEFERWALIKVGSFIFFNGWLPNSGYLLDDRAHFGILEDNYKNNNPLSEEEI